jgi:hypothetical protein
MRHAFVLLAVDVGDELVDGGGVVFRAGRDGQADGVQFHPRLGDFGDELVGARLVGVGDEFVQMADAEHGDDGMDADGQVGEFVAQRQILLQALFKFLKVAHHAANEIMFFADAVQGEVDDELALRCRF